MGFLDQFCSVGLSCSVLQWKKSGRKDVSVSKSCDSCVLVVGWFSLSVADNLLHLTSVTICTCDAVCFAQESSQGLGEKDLPQ